MSTVDHAFARARLGDPEGFAGWVRAVEFPLREALRRFARSVDVEAVVQEALLRMWVLAPTLELSGEDASLRYAHTIARNLALEECRRLRHAPPAGAGDDPDVVRDPRPEPPPDPLLRRVIRTCLGKIGGKPRRALQARLDAHGLVHDRVLAERLGLTLNTFLQNVTRAKNQLAACLARNGVHLERVTR